MIDAVWQRLDRSGKLVFPFLTAVASTLLGSLVWPLPYFGSVAPPLALMAIYYWALHRPDLFRPSMVFFIGLLNDIVNFFPLGLSSFLFVAAHQLVYQNRRYFVSHSFFLMWAGFMLTAFSVIGLQWLLFSLIHWHAAPVTSALAQILFAITLFPLPCWLFITFQRLLLATDGR